MCYDESPHIHSKHEKKQKIKYFFHIYNTNILISVEHGKKREKDLITSSIYKCTYFFFFTFTLYRSLRDATAAVTFYLTTSTALPLEQNAKKKFYNFYY